MADKDDSKQQALIISLICFVVLSLGLGVATYYGFAGQVELKKQADDAKKEREIQLKRGDWEQFQALALKAHLGHNLTKEDQEALAALRKGYEGGSLGKEEKDYADGKSLLDKLAQDMRWDKGKLQPTDTYFHKTESLENDNILLRSQLTKAQDDFNKSREKMDVDLKGNQAEKEEVAKALTISKADLAKTRSDKAAEFLAL